MKNDLRSGAVILLALAITGCSKGGPEIVRLPTSPVTGVIHVNGEPTAMVEVSCRPDAGSSEINYAVIAVSDEDGAFKLGTYESGDGLPAGSYTLTFNWIEMGLTPKDKFKGKYANPAKSEQKFTVEGHEEEQVDLGTIELTSK